MGPDPNVSWKRYWPIQMQSFFHSGKKQRIVDAEWNLRYTKKLNRFIKKATLKYPAADLDDTIYQPERQLDAHIIEELSKCE